MCFKGVNQAIAAPSLRNIYIPKLSSYCWWWQKTDSYFKLTTQQCHRPPKTSMWYHRGTQHQRLDAADLCQLAGWFGCWWVSPLCRLPSPPASEHTWRAAHRLFVSILLPVPPSLLSGWCRWRRMRQDHPVHWRGPHFWHFSKPSETRNNINTPGWERSIYDLRCTVCRLGMLNLYCRAQTMI